MERNGTPRRGEKEEGEESRREFSEDSSGWKGKERKGEIGEGGGKWRIVGRAPRGLKRNFVDGLCDA